MVRHDLDVSQVERLAAVALGEPNHHAAARLLLAALAELDSPVPGLRNVGLLATHELTAGVREMPEWGEAVNRSSPLLGERGRRLVERLGYTVEVLGSNTSMLTIGVGTVLSRCSATRTSRSMRQLDASTVRRRCLVGWRLRISRTWIG
ncbi:MAG: hypothetical protein OXF41_17245 [bacterium]|nr:hypothetical protein [bacterium]